MAEPSKERIEEENKLAKEWAKNEYIRNRQGIYPNLQECIHALLDGGDTLTKLQARRQEVKKQFPKPQ